MVSKELDSFCSLLPAVISGYDGKGNLLGGRLLLSLYQTMYRILNQSSTSMNCHRPLLHRSHMIHFRLLELLSEQCR